MSVAISHCDQGQMFLKHFVWNLRIFIISWSACPWQAFQANSNKHSSLAQKLVYYGQKSFITLVPGPKVIKPFDL